MQLSTSDFDDPVFTAWFDTWPELLAHMRAQHPDLPPQAGEEAVVWEIRIAEKYGPGDPYYVLDQMNEQEIMAFDLGLLWKPDAQKGSYGAA